MFNKSPPLSPRWLTELDRFSSTACLFLCRSTEFAECCPSCQCWPSRGWLTLSLPVGWQSPGVSPGLLKASKVLWAGTGREGDVQGKLKEQKVGQFPLPLPQGKPISSTICWDLEGSARLPPGTGGLAVTYLSCSSTRRCLGIYREARNRLNSSPQALSVSPCSPCIPLARREGRLFLDQTALGVGRARLLKHFYFLPLHICSLPLPSGWSWVSIFIKRRK